MEWRERDGLRWLEAEMGGARAAFSTRVGGLSTEPYEALNLSLTTGDDREHVRQNRDRLVRALELQPDRVLMAHQVHGGRLLRHRGPQSPSTWADALPSPDDADAHATSEPRLAATVMVADCLPVAVAGPGGVAMAHCGWRGLAAGLAGAAAREVAAERAAIGPGIGPCCYEVGAEVLAAFEGIAGAAAGRMLDLGLVARDQLGSAGVREVELSGLCTSCEPELFYSHRRDGARTGRQAGLAWLS